MLPTSMFYGMQYPITLINNIVASDSMNTGYLKVTSYDNLIKMYDVLIPSIGAMLKNSHC